MAAFLAPAIKQDHSKRCENKPLQHRQTHPHDAKAPLFPIQAHRPGKLQDRYQTTTKKARQCGPFLNWSGREDSNLRHPPPEGGALPG